MKLLTTAISMRWENEVFHHRTHFLWVLNAERIWSDLSTALIFMLYVLKIVGCFTSLSPHSPSVLTLQVTWPCSFALPTVVIMDTTLSTHWSTRQGGSLTQRILPRSRPLAHSWLFLRASGKLRLLGKIVPVAMTP